MAGSSAVGLEGSAAAYCAPNVSGTMSVPIMAASKKASAKKAPSKKPSGEPASAKKAAKKAPPTPAAGRQSTGKGATKKPAKATAALPSASSEREFAGFPKSGVAFLAELRMNNDRDWFKVNQPRYEELVRDPALSFIRAMAPELARLSKHFVAADKKVGGSLMRLQRDTRFASNKDPYKTNVGIQFRHVVGKDVHAPGFYFHIDPDRVFAGVGLWHPEPDALRAVRQGVVSKPKEYERAVAQELFAKRFAIGGDSLVRPPQGFDPNHPLIDVLKRKDHIAIVDLQHRDVYSGKLVGQLSELFDAAAPFMRFLCQSMGLSY